MAHRIRLGIVGLGLVGRALARRARRAGMAAIGCDPLSDAVAAARGEGVEIADGPSALAGRCDGAVIAVFDGVQLEEVVREILQAPARPDLLLHCVTAEPELTEALAERCQAAGVHFVEMPLSGSSRQIEAGEALALVGATEAGWVRSRRLIEALSPQAVHVGDPGMGARAKLATNLVLGLNRAVLAEGLLLAETLGIDGQRFLDLLRRSPAYSRAVDTAGPRMVAGDFAPVSRLRQHRKDIALMLEAARRGRIDLPFSRTHASLLDEAEAQGRGDLDNVAILAVLRDRSAPSVPEIDR